MNLSEEVKAMIEKKAEELYPYEDNFLGQPIRRSKHKDSVDNERKQWQAGILFVLSDPELLSKAGWVKKEESVTIESLTPDLIDRRLIIICNVEESFVYLSAKHTAEFLLDKYQITTLPSPPQK